MVITLIKSNAATSIAPLSHSQSCSKNISRYQCNIIFSDTKLADADRIVNDGNEVKAFFVKLLSDMERRCRIFVVYSGSGLL